MEIMLESESRKLEKEKVLNKKFEGFMLQRCEDVKLKRVEILRVRDRGDILGVQRKDKAESPAL